MTSPWVIAMVDRDVDRSCRRGDGGTTVKPSPRMRLGTLAASAVLVTALVPGVVHAQPSKTVTIAVYVDANVQGDQAWATVVVVGQGIRSITSCSYSLDDGPATDCGPASVGKKEWRYALAFGIQAVGDHAVVVTVGSSKGAAVGGDTFIIDP